MLRLPELLELSSTRWRLSLIASHFLLLLILLIQVFPLILSKEKTGDILTPENTIEYLNSHIRRRRRRVLIGSMFLSQIRLILTRSCEYKFGIDFIADDINRRWMNDNKAVGYSSLVSNKFLFEVLTWNVVLGIPSSNKDQYGTRFGGCFTSYTNVKITSISKKCGGAGGTSGNITISRDLST